jgi:hypothetical protein
VRLYPGKPGKQPGEKILMTKQILLIFVCLLFVNSVHSQNLPDLKLSEKNNSELSFNSRKFPLNVYEKVTQLPKRKSVNRYFGAGYSFVIFTDKTMNTAYPVLDTRNGNFLTDINLYFGFAIAQAVTLEIEPSILFTSNTRLVTFYLKQPVNINGTDYYYTNTNSLSMLAFPIVLNARFFPLFKLPSFLRLFFVGGGAGMLWVREQYDNVYSNTPGGVYTSGILRTESTSQWAPLFRVMTGFTGTGGQFGFGGEIRYNIIPLKESNDPFATRYAKNFNSVDLTLRFYFSL